MPYLEANDIVDSFEKNNKLEKFKLPFANCPYRGILEENQISYAGNCGRTDGLLVNPIGDVFITSDQTKNYGIMNDFGFNSIAGNNHWQDNNGKILEMDDIKDGSGNTLFITENLQSGDLWSHEEFQVGFVYTSEENPASYGNGTVTLCTSNCDQFFNDIYSACNLYDSGQAVVFDTIAYNRNTDNDEKWAREPVLPINKCASVLENRAYAWATARPSSNHEGIIVAAFCDGSCKIISETVEPKIFRQAMCPNDKIIGITENSINLQFK